MKLRMHTIVDINYDTDNTHVYCEDRTYTIFSENQEWERIPGNKVIGLIFMEWYINLLQNIIYSLINAYLEFHTES